MTQFNYDPIADLYAAGVDDRSYNQLYERPAMLAALPEVKGSRILDAGCGPGWYAEQLIARGATVTGVDASERMVEHARRRVGRVPDFVARFLKADLSEPLSFAADASFDGVLCSLALHYMDDWKNALAEFHRVLTPAGWLVFSTHHPAEESMRVGTKRYLDVELVRDYWQWLGDVQYYRRPMSRIVNDLVEAGFRVTRMIEPLPTKEFRAHEPEAYERLLAQPAFLIVKAQR